MWPNIYAVKGMCTYTAQGSSAQVAITLLITSLCNKLVFAAIKCFEYQILGFKCSCANPLESYPPFGRRKKGN